MTVPTQTALTLPRTGLGHSLGQGLEEGTRSGLQGLLKNFITSKQQEGLTEFQKISTDLREKEQAQKTENAILKTMITLADPIKGGSLDQSNITTAAKEANSLIKKGVDPLEAIDKSVRNIQSQSNALGLKKSVKATVDIPKFNLKKLEDIKKTTLEQLKENNITNPTLVNRALTAKKWPVKDRQDLIKRLKGFGQTQKLKIKFNPQNPAHIKRRSEILAQTKGNRQQAQQILSREFE